MAKIELDEKLPARRVSFPILAQLLSIVCHQGQVSYTGLQKRASREGVLRTDSGRPFAKSTYYHHINALKILGLITKKDTLYVASELGCKIAAAADYSQASHANETKRLFRQAILRCALAKRNFFVLFTGEPDADPFDHPQPVSYYPTGDRRYTVSSPHLDNPIRLSKDQTEGLIWGIRLWCLETGLIDEILMPPRFEVLPEKANILFLVWRSAADYMPLDKFIDTLIQYLPVDKTAYSDTIRADIPLLLYQLCPAEGLPVADAQFLLSRLLESYPRLVFAESPTLALLSAGKTRVQKRAWEKQLATAYLPANGQYYSKIFVSKALWQDHQEANPT